MQKFVFVIRKLSRKKIPWKNVAAATINGTKKWLKSPPILYPSVSTPTLYPVVSTPILYPAVLTPSLYPAVLTPTLYPACIYSYFVSCSINPYPVSFNMQYLPLPLPSILYPTASTPIFCIHHPAVSTPSYGFQRMKTFAKKCKNLCS